MNKYTYMSPDESTTIEMTCKNHLCSDVVRNFMYFLQGCSFQKSIILEAFATIVEEHSEQPEEHKWGSPTHE